MKYIRYIIAAILDWVFIMPIANIIDFIYPEGTQMGMAFWLQEDKKKVRCRLINKPWRPKRYKNGIGIPIDGWNEVVQRINQKINLG